MFSNKFSNKTSIKQTLSKISVFNSKTPSKKMFNTLFLSISLVTASTALVACSNSSTKTESEPKAEKSEQQTEVTDTKTESSTNDDVTLLRFSHFLPAPSYINKEVLEPWAEKIAKDSNGRLKIEIYPGATLTKPTQTYDATAKGTVDIGLQLHGMANGRFPLVEMAELPGMTSTATQTSCLVQKLKDEGVYDEEYADTHVLAVFGSASGVIHSKDKLVKTPEDVKGMRIRRPSAVPADIIESMGGSPVGIPPPDMYASLQRGVVDAVAITWDGFNIFRLEELARKHTVMPFYTSTMVITMNQDKYDSLPDDLKKVFDDNSGSVLSQKLGRVMDSHAQAGYEKAKAAGDEIFEIADPLNDPNWSKPLQAGTQKYLDSVEAKGKDANGIFEKTKLAAEACK